MKTLHHIAIALSFLSVMGNASCGEFEEKMARDIMGAERSILVSLATHRSTGGKYLCTQNLYACAGTDKAELGLSLIGGSRSSRAPRALVGLARFKMDAGLSSDFKCYIGYRGSAVTQWMNSTDTSALSDQCHKELVDLKRRARAVYDVDASEICRTPQELATFLRELKEVTRVEPGCD